MTKNKLTTIAYRTAVVLLLAAIVVGVWKAVIIAESILREVGR